MDIVQFIAAKRDGQEHTSDAIADFIGGYVQGSVADYQASAWLMAAYLKGLSPRETLALTETLTHSGRTYALGHFGAHSVDKHSTGGVGDKTSLVVVPLCASLGATVPKMSGRGLGFTGGTLDKLESIPGLRTRLPAEEFEGIVQQYGAAICAQTPDLVPADGKLYALRDVTATVDSIPLIAASVMSKKLAMGCPAIVLDVKVGSGAFMPCLDQARALAQMMIALGSSAGRHMVALLSAMDQPLGEAVGNALEVREAWQVLNGAGPLDFRQHCQRVAAEMLVAAGLFADTDSAIDACERALSDGSAAERFLQIVSAQGGQAGALTQDRLPGASVIHEVHSPRAGYVTSLEARAIGRAVMALGAGRVRKEDTVDPAVGVVLHAKVGSPVERGQTLALVHVRDAASALAAEQAVAAAYTFGESQPETPPLIYEVLRG